MSRAQSVLEVMDADGRAVACVIDECATLRREQEWRDHLVRHDQARASVKETALALIELVAWVERAIVPEYGPRKPMPENCRKALERAHAALEQFGGAT